MSVRTILAAVVALGIPVVAIATVASASAPVAYVPVPRGGAVILDTGSTNAVGYRISVARNGEVWYVSGDGAPRPGHVDASLADAFFADLRTAMPLSRLPLPHCMKSVSFGTSTFVWWHGQRSPDISCPGDAKSDTLYAEAEKIAAALNLGPTHFRTLPRNEPRRPLPASPAPTPTM